MKKILIYFVIYYILGFILINAFTISRFLGSTKNVADISPIIIKRNISAPFIYGVTLVWPIYLGINIYNFATGNVGD